MIHTPPTSSLTQSAVQDDLVNDWYAHSRLLGTPFTPSRQTEFAQRSGDRDHPQGTVAIAQPGVQFVSLGPWGTRPRRATVPRSATVTVRLADMQPSGYLCPTGRDVAGRGPVPLTTFAIRTVHLYSGPRRGPRRSGRADWPATHPGRAIPQRANRPPGFRLPTAAAHACSGKPSAIHRTGSTGGGRRSSGLCRRRRRKSS